MLKKIVIILAVMVALMVVVQVILLLAKKKEMANMPVPVGQSVVDKDGMRSIVYVPKLGGGQELTVVYRKGSAEVSNLPDLGTVTMTQVETASGTRYDNTEKGASLLEKNGEIAVLVNNAKVYEGRVRKNLSLAEGTWRFDKMVMNDGTIMSPKKTDAFTLTFGADGSVAGTTDCNDFTGTVSVSGERFTFGDMASTKKACDGSQEAEFLEKLSEVDRYMQSETTLSLMLKGDAGTIVFLK